MPERPVVRLHRLTPAPVCFALALSATDAHAQPGPSRAEATQLYEAAGFPVTAGMPRNRCGTPARPRVTFVDLNGDQRPEALFIDEGPCYAPAGRYVVVLARQGDVWRAVGSAPGAIQALQSRTSGWLDMRVTAPGCAQDFRFHGDRYVATSDCAGRAITAGAQAPTTRAAPPPAPLATAPPAPSSGAPMRLASTEEAAVFKAAGFTRHGNRWRSDCEDPGTPSYTPGTIDKVVDLNGDDRPEVIISEGGSYCYGNRARILRRD